MRGKNRNNYIRLIIGGALILAAGLLMLLFKSFPDFFFPAYRHFSSSLMDIISRVLSFSRITLWDIGEVLAILFLIFTIVRMIVRKRPFLRWFSHVFLTISILVFLVVSIWMLNHYARPLSDELELPIRQYTKAELADAFSWYLGQAADTAPLVPRDENGDLVRQDFYELAEIAGASYEKLSDRYPVFCGSTKPVKKLWLTGEWLLVKGFTGIFMPFTAEASVPANGAVSDLPFTMCHEAAHRVGIAGENEANFSAFLACTHSGDVRFRYAGYYMAYVYCSNALYKEDKKLRESLIEARGDDPGTDLVLRDAHTQRVHYEKYDGPIADAGDKVNDTYLKSFSEESGTKSYGEVVNELVAWYLQNFSLDKE